MIDMMEMGMNMGKDSKDNDKFNKDKMEFGEPKIEGDKATVSVKEKGTEDTQNFILKKEDGSWKVAFDKASIMSMGMEKWRMKVWTRPTAWIKPWTNWKYGHGFTEKDKVNEGMQKNDSIKKLLKTKPIDLYFNW